MPDVRADGIAVYVYRKVSGAEGAGWEFLQIRRSDKTGEYQHSWQTVYGGVERGGDEKWKETATQAALRELKEETGLVPRRLWQVEYLECFYFRPHDYVLMMPVFAAEVGGAGEDVTITLNEEHDGIRWIPAGEIDGAFMWRTQREALGHILEVLQHGSEAMKFLEVPMARSVTKG